MSPTPTVPVTLDIVTEGLGAFDELELLGQGTFGTTFRALRGEDEYTIKVLHVSDMPQYLWERELTALQAVEHPNVVRFRRSGEFVAEDMTFPFLECEFIAGGTVSQQLTSHQRPPSSAALREFLTGLLSGVVEIHDLGIVHRDIKPSNICLRDGDWGQPVFLDFGLARILSMSSHTTYPTHIGTYRYMSPEQLRAEPARTRSDLFSIGVVVYEAGTGSHPFIEGASITLQALHDRIAYGPPPDPRPISSIWSEDITTVVLRLLSFQGYDRLSATRALRDLEGP